MATTPVWNSIEAPLAHEILLCAQETQKKLYTAALDIMSKQMGLRAAKILEMPKIERHLIWQKLLGRGHLEALSFNLLSNWLMQTQTPMLCLWLDTLSIQHNGQGITDVFPPCPAKAQLQETVEKLLALFEPKLVSIYLRTFNEIEGVQWAELAEVVAADSRLAL
jgi:hypothetical protein